MKRKEIVLLISEDESVEIQQAIKYLKAFSRRSKTLGIALKWFMRISCVVGNDVDCEEQ